MSLNSIDDKLEWIFCLFDTDGGGSVDLTEIEVQCFDSLPFSGLVSLVQFIDIKLLSIFISKLHLYFLLGNC